MFRFLCSNLLPLALQSLNNRPLPLAPPPLIVFLLPSIRPDGPAVADAHPGRDWVRDDPRAQKSRKRLGPTSGYKLYEDVEEVAEEATEAEPCENLRGRVVVEVVPGAWGEIEKPEDMA